VTADLLKTAIAGFLAIESTRHPALAGVPVTLSGEITDAAFPMISVEETMCELYVQDGVIMRGVNTVEIFVSVHSVPASDAEGGTSPEDHEAIAEAVYQRLGSQAFRDFADDGILRLFDFRTAAPRIEADPPRRVSVIEIEAIACQT